MLLIHSVSNRNLIVQFHCLSSYRLYTVKNLSHFSYSSKHHLSGDNPNPIFLHENALSPYELFPVEKFTARMFFEQDFSLFILFF